MKAGQSTSCFESLLSQLAAEYSRTVTSLTSEIARLQKDTSSSGLNAPLSGFTTGDSNRASTVVGQEASETLPTPQADRSRYTTTLGSNENLRAPTMNWALSSERPKKEYLSSQFASQIAQCLGFASQRIDSFIYWWSMLHEPMRVGRCGRFVRSSFLHALSLLVIILNTVFIALVTDNDMKYARSESSSAFFTGSSERIIEVGFFSFYVLEVACKLYVHRLYFFIRSGWKWNVFDLVLVIFSLCDLIIEAVASDHGHRPSISFLRVLRVLKLARILRILRVMGSVQELRLLMECILNSANHLLWCILLLCLFLFMFALVLVQGLTEYLRENDDIPAKYDYAVNGFSSVPSACLSLFMATTNGWDWKDIYDFMSEVGYGYRIIFVFYITFFVIAVWNIVLSTFVEKAFRLALPDLETVVLQKKQEELRIAAELERLLTENFDENSDGYISKEEFKHRFTDDRVKNVFAARDMDLKDIELFFNMIASSFDASPGVPVNAFVNACSRMRGAASNVDLQALHFDFRRHTYRLDTKLQRIQESIERGKLLETMLRVDDSSALSGPPHSGSSRMAL